MPLSSDTPYRESAFTRANHVGYRIFNQRVFAVAFPSASPSTPLLTSAMVQAESSSAAANKRLKPNTNGSSPDYELPWY